MPERELLSRPEPLTHEVLCDISSRWLVTPETMSKVILASQAFTFQTGREVFLISGWRSAREQKRLGRSGRPTAPDDLSTHRSCLATGVDVDLGFLISNAMKVLMGAAAFSQGLRWGGGSPVDPATGIPSDWNHFDLGPRNKTLGKEIQ